MFNWFLANCPILQPLKTPETKDFPMFSEVINGNNGQLWVNFTCSIKKAVVERLQIYTQIEALVRIYYSKNSQTANRN